MSVIPSAAFALSVWGIYILLGKANLNRLFPMLNIHTIIIDQFRFRSSVYAGIVVYKVFAGIIHANVVVEIAWLRSTLRKNSAAARPWLR